MCPEKSARCVPEARSIRRIPAPIVEARRQFPSAVRRIEVTGAPKSSEVTFPGGGGATAQTRGGGISSCPLAGRCTHAAGSQPRKEDVGTSPAPSRMSNERTVPSTLPARIVGPSRARDVTESLNGAIV